MAEFGYAGMKAALGSPYRYIETLIVKHVHHGGMINNGSSWLICALELDIP